MCIASVGAVVLLSSCASSDYVRKENAEKKMQVQNAQQKAYVARKTSLTYGNSVPPSGNTCIDNFSFLKEAGNSAYGDYTRDYARINSGYVFLNKNRNIMDGTAKEMYAQALNMKLDALCARVKYSGFELVKNRISTLNGS